MLPPTSAASRAAARCTADRPQSHGRIEERKLRPWREDYLHYRYLWPNIRRAVAEALAHVPAEHPFVLDLGCGNRPYRDLFEGCRYLGSDYSAYDTRPDVITDGTRLAFNDQSFDIVFCTQVIEHVPDPLALVLESFRVLRSGGILVLTGPFWWPLHEEPHDYHRFTHYGLSHLLRTAGYIDWDVRPDGGDWAQFFLGLALRFGGLPLAPVRLAINVIGATVDWLAPSFRCPANYTVLARKGKAAVG